MPSCHSSSAKFDVTMQKLKEEQHHNAIECLQAGSNLGDGAQHMGFAEPLLEGFGCVTTTQEALMTEQIQADSRTITPVQIPGLR